MKQKSGKEYAVDNASILFLALLRKTHSNIFRFSITLSETISPEVLQQAVNNTYRRFPTIYARIKPGPFSYAVVPIEHAPLVQPDPGCLLTMSKEEVQRCAYRVYYEENVISIEAYHVLTDGHGAIISISTLAAEYLRLRYGKEIPAELTVYDLSQIPGEEETEDAYVAHQQGKPKHLPSRYSYQLPGTPNDHWHVVNTCLTYSTQKILNAAHKYGVSANTLLAAVMADAAMELQTRHHASGQRKPVRVMVPVNLRRFYSSRTLRNFSWYVLPTIEPEQRNHTLVSHIASFHEQFQRLIDKDTFSAIMAHNVWLQNFPVFRFLPSAVKFAVMRLIYRFFGESNSTVTVTNLGNLKIPKEMKPYVRKVDVVMTPRRCSPYGCTIISYDDQFEINISRFCHETELIDIFSDKMNEILHA